MNVKGEQDLEQIRSFSPVLPMKGYTCVSLSLESKQMQVQPELPVWYRTKRGHGKGGEGRASEFEKSPAR